ncbi:MAG: 23S rRNA (guanosine(2251)-2'-O)-methyltransferase RlmB [Sphingomonadales bacterium]
MTKSKRKHRARPGLWLHGRHAVLAALANPARSCLRLLVTKDTARSLEHCDDFPGGLEPTIVDRAEIARQLPPEAVHQGVALQVDPLPGTALEDALDHPADHPVVVVLDQVTDPHNVGAILRSAAAFGAAAVITTEAHAPPETGALARAASGALEAVPFVRCVNLARALDYLADQGYWRVGLDGAADKTLGDAMPLDRVALVLGSEGKGMRRLTRERCDLLVRLPISDAVESLNVSNAAAVALYELARKAPIS